MKYLLHKQVRKCNVTGVKFAIKIGCDLNKLDDHGNTPLHWAVLGGYLNIVKILLEAGANPNTLSNDGITPKWSAADFGLTAIEDLLTRYGGKIATGPGFDEISWSVFKGALGQSLPQEEQ